MSHSAPLRTAWCDSSHSVTMLRVYNTHLDHYTSVYQASNIAQISREHSPAKRACFAGRSASVSCGRFTCWLSPRAKPLLAVHFAECCCPLFVCYLLVGGCSLLGGCNLKNLSSELSSLALAAAAAASATRFTLAAAAAARPPWLSQCCGLRPALRRLPPWPPFLMYFLTMLCHDEPRSRWLAPRAGEGVMRRTELDFFGVRISRLSETDTRK